MAKKRGTERRNGRVRVPLGPHHFLYDAAQIAAEQEAEVLARYRDPAMALKTYDHAPRGGRIVAELDDLLTRDGVLGLPIRDRVKTYLDWLKDQYRLPRWHKFFPREHVPPGREPYDEEFVREEYIGQINTGAGLLTAASGFASFNPGSGVFSMVGYSMGSVAAVSAGPIVTMETQQHPADVVLTANFLLDYRYQLSASLNPAFQPASSTSEEISVRVDLFLDIDLRRLGGGQLGISRALKRVKHAEIQPDSTLPPYVVGYQEIVPGYSLQGSEINVPITWEHTFSAPANCRIQVGVTVALFVTAAGYRGSTRYRHLGIADGRASGQVTSVEAMLFT